MTAKANYLERIRREAKEQGIPVRDVIKLHSRTQPTTRSDEVLDREALDWLEKLEGRTA